VTAAIWFGNGRGVTVGVLAVCASATVVFRRRHSLAVLAFLSAANLALALVGKPGLEPALAVAFYCVAFYLPRATSLRAGAVAFAAAAAAAVADHPHDFGGNVGGLVLLAGAWLVGDNVRARRDRVAEQERRAVADERARIARELHDMVTHNVSVMVVQAAAGNEVFDQHPEQARTAFRAVEETGRRALGELRRLLDVVADDESAGYDPQPGLRRLDELVDSVRATGLGVELTVEGTPRELSPALELSAFRIVQEALTNTLRHAGASRASVRVSYEPDALELEVADDGVGGGSTEGGRGLVGMRERVALFGGDLATGARPGGGFAVRARMPLETS